MAHRVNVISDALRRLFGSLGTVIAAVMLVGGCATVGVPSYSAEPIEAWVVDEQTGESLEGVVVVANWLLMRGTLGGRTQLGPLMVLEAVSDARGRFFLPAWGPVPNRTPGFLDHEDPELWFFKPGYQLVGVANHYASDHRTKPSTRKSDWNGKVIRLKRFAGEREKYAEHIASRGWSLSSTLKWYEECTITRTPKLAAALDRENTRLKQNGFDKGGFTYRALLPEYISKCAIRIPEGAL